jgi:hypothetical protein
MTTKKGEMKKIRSEANERQIILTKVSRVVRFRTPQSDILGERHDVLAFALVDALTVGHDVHVVEHFKYFCGRRVDRADDSSAAMSDPPEKFYALRAAVTVQAGCRFIEKQNWRIIHLKGPVICRLLVANAKNKLQIRHSPVLEQSKVFLVLHQRGCCNQCLQHYRASKG